jgi:signal transduction histidine kinase
VQAQTIAAIVGDPATQRDLQSTVARLAQDARTGRVIVVNAQGLLVADSAGNGLLQQPYLTDGRPELGIALRQGVPGTRIGRSESLGGAEILAAAAPILVPGRSTPVGAVRLTEPTTQLRASIRRTLVGIAAIGIGGLVAGLAIAFVLAGSLSKPLHRLAGASKRLGAGDLSVRAGPHEGASEIREMAASFDEMAERLERLVQAQREFAGNASHQLRTPLTGLKLRLESAAAKAPPELRRDLEAAEREADRLAGIVSSLMTLARRIETGAAPEVDIADVVDRASARWRDRAAATGTEIRAVGSSATVAADPSDVGQILDNLIDNAIRYAPGNITIEFARDDECVRLAVEDRGPGIPADELDRVTERFYRGRSSPPGGSGLGLSVVRELAERWGGRVAVKRASSGGTRIEVLLPLPSQDA